jgi:hypothetical protein
MERDLGKSVSRHSIVGSELIGFLHCVVWRYQNTEVIFDP